MTHENHDYNYDEEDKLNVLKLVKIQALFRGYMLRKRMS